jgi:acetyl esterase/lipase
LSTFVLDEQFTAGLEAFGAFQVSSETLAAIRQFTFPTPELSDAVERVDHVVSSDPPVVVRVHTIKRAAAGLRPCVYSIHGGGMVMGSFDMDDPRFDRWCPRFDCVGVSVEYRLAPETSYPGPLEDCYAGLRWVYEHAGDLGVDPDRIGIAGVSAGGGLAAGLALLARDRGEVPLRFQLLECPMLDDRQQTASSQLDGLPIWSRESNEFGWRSYLGERYGTEDVADYAAPARATDLAGLPPALVCVGAADGFCDEDVDYALRLNRARVPAELHVYPGAPHGISAFPDTAVARQYMRDIEDWLARALPA